jgi:hypothetical protein
MKSSGTERFLKGKNVPFCDGRVKQILQYGEQKRIVVDEKGKRKVVTKRELMNAFNKVLREHQLKGMMKTVREQRDLTATAMLGGKVRGERKHYASVAAAKRAIKRAYAK